MTQRIGYLQEFIKFWTEQSEVQKIWVSLYTPQVGEASSEVLPPEARERVINELFELKKSFQKLELPDGLLQAYRHPPSDPSHCVFALTTQTISADLKTKVIPCQLGGKPDCRQCGCIAAAAMEAVNRHRLPIGLRTGVIYGISQTLGFYLKDLRDARFNLFQPRFAAALHVGNQHIDRKENACMGQAPEVRMDGA